MNLRTLVVLLKVPQPLVSPAPRVKRLSIGVEFYDVARKAGSRGWLRPGSSSVLSVYGGSPSESSGVESECEAIAMRRPRLRETRGRRKRLATAWILQA